MGNNILKRTNKISAIFGYLTGITLMYVSLATSWAIFAIIGVIILITSFMNGINTMSQSKPMVVNEQMFQKQSLTEDGEWNIFAKPFKADPMVIEEIPFEEITIKTKNL